jgi:hypothetical protein
MDGLRLKKIIIFLSTLFIVLLILNIQLAISSTITNWYSRYSITADKRLEGIAYGNGLFVAVGNLGTILTSPDGRNWTLREAGTADDLQGITYGNNMFVATGNTGTILTSTDGITWTPRTSGTSTGIWGITFGNGIFVAVGGYSYTATIILSSSDGIEWTIRTAGSSNCLNSVTYGKGIFVAVGNGGRIRTSTDGIVWTTRSSGTSEWLYTIIYSKDIFVTVGDAGVILTSTDGITWIKRASGTSSSLRSITYGNNIFFVGVYSSSGPSFLTSTDGITWSPSATGNSHLWLSAVTYGNDTLVGVTSTDIYQSNPVVASISVIKSGSGTGTVIGSSGSMDCDDICNIRVDPGASMTLSATATAGSYFAGWFGAGCAGTSTCTVTANNNISVNACFNLNTDQLGKWAKKQEVPNGYFQRILYNNGTYVSLWTSTETRPYTSRIFTSPDGIVWTERIITKEPFYFSISYYNNYFYAYGVSSYNSKTGTYDVAKIFQSFDGITWTELSTPSNFIYPFNLYLYNNRFFASGFYFDSVFTSPDGITWDRLNIDSEIYYMNLWYVNNVYYAFGSYYNPITYSSELRLYSSLDGNTWERQEIENELTLVSFNVAKNIVANYVIIALGYSDTSQTIKMFTSKDGFTWKQKAILNEHNSTFRVSSYYNDNSFYATELTSYNSSLYMYDKAKLFRSSDLVTWEQIATFNGPFSNFYVTYANDGLLAIGMPSISTPQIYQYRFYTSNDGLTWIERNVSNDLTKMSVTYLNGILYVYGSYFDGSTGLETGIILSPLIPCDVNGNGNIDLSDAILGIQIVSGMTPTGIIKEVAVNNDKRIGLPEVIYILQNVAGMR